MYRTRSKTHSNAVDVWRSEEWLNDSFGGAPTLVKETSIYDPDLYLFIDDNDILARENDLLPEN